MFNLNLFIMKKRILSFCLFTAFAFLVTSLSFDASAQDVCLSESSSTCTSSSSSNNGTCRARIDGCGDSCVAAGFWDSKNCNGQI